MSFQTCIFAHFNCCVRQGTNLLPSFVIGKYPSSPCVSPQPARRPCALLLLTSGTLRVINAYYAWRPSLTPSFHYPTETPATPMLMPIAHRTSIPPPTRLHWGKGTQRRTVRRRVILHPRFRGVRQSFFFFWQLIVSCPCQ